MSGPETIVTAAVARLAQTVGAGDLAGRHALVTSGPTVEPLDAVRFISTIPQGVRGMPLPQRWSNAGPG